jgi:ATP-dependent Clp protease ATP-binding subunit ClpA
MFERFTVAAREVVTSAQYEREAMQHRFVGTEHLLLGLLNEGAGAAYTVLTRAGLTRALVREDVKRFIGDTPLGEADAAALRVIGIDLDEVRAKVEQQFGPGSLRPPAPPRQGLFFGRRGSLAVGGRFSARAKKVLELALREAIQLHHRSLGPEHILLGLLREGEGLGAQILHERGIVSSDVRRELLDELKAA